MSLICQACSEEIAIRLAFYSQVYVEITDEIQTEICGRNSVVVLSVRVLAQEFFLGAPKRSG